MRLAKFLFLLFCTLAISGCRHNENIIAAQVHESVMTDGMIICADFDEKVCVKAENLLLRHIKWDDITRSVKLIPRNERWHGKLGLYYPGVGNHWEYHKGLTRGIIQEAQLHFASEKDVFSFLNKFIDNKNVLYRDDGLMVLWRKVIRPDEAPGGYIDLSIFQILIDGKKPKKLHGSQNDKISVTLSVH